jgi:hypothetical protein
MPHSGRYSAVEEQLVPILQTGWASWPTWTDLENIAPYLIRTLYHPAKWLYRPGYPNVSMRHKNFHCETIGL